MAIRRSPGPDRPKRILDAAEAVFAESGFAGASLRQIVSRARVNLATVYYYYRSKNGLMEAVLERRFGSLRREHMDLLKRAEQEAPGQPARLEAILEAMLLPPLRLAAAPPAKRQAVMRLIGRIVTEPNPQTQEQLRRRNADVRAAFLRALQASLPSLPARELRWRLEFTWGALAFILCNPRHLERETEGACDPADTPQVLAEMIRFFAAGFRAPATEGAEESGGESRMANPEELGSGDATAVPSRSERAGANVAGPG
jgi:AcrR family transcriptional regulator